MSVTVIRHTLHALSETMKPLRMSVDFNIMTLSGDAMAKQYEVNLSHDWLLCTTLHKYTSGPGHTRDWLPAYSFVLRARARRDTTRHDCYVVIRAHTGVTIV